MNMIPAAPNDGGAYCFHKSSLTALPEGMLLWPDGLSTDLFFEHNGMILPEIQGKDGVPAVSGYAVNREAWETWEERQAMGPGELTEIQPTPEERLRADMDYLAVMMGVEL